MSIKKIRFTVVDFCIILVVLFILFSISIRNVSVENYEEKVKPEDVKITLFISSLDRKLLNELNVGDEVHGDGKFSDSVIGKVSLIRSNPAVVQGQTDYSSVDVYLEIETKANVSINDFYTVNNSIIAPALTFKAHNGRIGFNCEVHSVKKT